MRVLDLQPSFLGSHRYTAPSCNLHNHSFAPSFNVPPSAGMPMQVCFNKGLYKSWALQGLSPLQKAHPGMAPLQLHVKGWLLERHLGDSNRPRCGKAFPKPQIRTREGSQMLIREKQFLCSACSLQSAFDTFLWQRTIQALKV